MKITKTLNLDKEGALKRYIGIVCDILGITLDQVYATNVFKYFYTIPPADTQDVLSAHKDANVELLKEELMQYPNAKVITLGEPVLKLLTNSKTKVRSFWGYILHKPHGEFSYSPKEENLLGLDLFPFPHQPSMRKEFYKDTLDEYCNYVKEK